MIDTLKEIETLLVKYYKEGSSLGIDDLLSLRDKLAIHSYRLAEYTADAKTSYNVSYFTRKITVSKQKGAVIQSKGVSAAQATIEAESDNEDLFQQEQVDEANAYRHDLLLRQVNQILAAMQQRISYLKNEKQTTGNNREENWEKL